MANQEHLDIINKNNGVEKISKLNEQLLCNFYNKKHPDLEQNDLEPIASFDKIPKQELHDLLNSLSEFERKQAYKNGELIDLNGDDFRDLNFDNANLIGVNFSLSSLNNAKFLSTDLSGANLEGAKLIDANLIGANLQNVDFKLASLNKAKFLNADLSGANLAGAKLQGADLKGAIGLDKIKDFEFIIFDKGTQIDSDAPEPMQKLKAAAIRGGGNCVRWENGKAVAGNYHGITFEKLPPSQEFTAGEAEKARDKGGIRIP